MNTSLSARLQKAGINVHDELQGLQPESPWYLKLILAFSGWLAANFVLGFFFALFSRLYRNIPLLMVLGVGLIGIAYMLLRNKKNEFIEHLALALSLAGQVLIVVAMFLFFDVNNQMFYILLVIGLFEGFLALIMPDYIHRVFSSFIASISLALSLFYINHSLAMLDIFNAALLLIVGLFWLNEFKPAFLAISGIRKRQAIAYGMTLALLVINVSKLFSATSLFNNHRFQVHEFSWYQPWMTEILLGLMATFVIWQLLKRVSAHNGALSNRTYLITLVATLIVTLLSSQAHGLIVGVIILVLGFANSNRVLFGLGLITLLFFIAYYYTTLSTTLLYKSLHLLVLGLLLLTSYWVLKKWLLLVNKEVRS